MANPPEKINAPRPSAKELRERRLAEVLRANLKRRKASSTASTDADEGCDVRDQDSQTTD